MLVSKNELAALFEFIEQSLGPFYLYYCGIVCHKNNGPVSKQDFLKAYGNYIDSLMKGQTPDLNFYRSAFSPAITLIAGALFTIPVGEDREIIRISEPVLQLQAHNMDYSTVDKKFRPMVFGLESIAWGIQFSYPQLVQDNGTGQIEMIKKSSKFPNTALFQMVQKWMRQHTVPTPFIAEGNLFNVPMRLGKECFAWINQHPQLVQKNITVKI